MELREIEKEKIECSKKHFKCICSDEVKYDIVTTYEELINLVS